MYHNLFEQLFITDICSLQFSAFTYNAMLNYNDMQNTRNIFDNNTQHTLSTLVLKCFKLWYFFDELECGHLFEAVVLLSYR